MESRVEPVYAQTYLYVIVCRNDTYYVGVTNDLEKRFYQHMTETGATKTRVHGFVRVVTAYLFSSRHAALVAEIVIQKWLRRMIPSLTADPAIEDLLNQRYAAQQYRDGSSWDVEHRKMDRRGFQDIRQGAMSFQP